MDITSLAPILLIIIAPPALVALAVALDTQSRRGYALGALALVTLVYGLWSIGAVAQTAAQLASAAAGDDLGLLGLAVYDVVGFYVALTLTLGAIGETLIARQTEWLWIIVAVSVIPAVLIHTVATLAPNLLSALGLQPLAAFLVLLLLPVVGVLSYAIARSVRRPLAR